MEKTICVYFGTSNLNKFKEINLIFNKKSSLQVRHAPISLVEIQSENLEEIAINSLKTGSMEFKDRPLFVEDSGLFIKSLGGFPGPYSAYIFGTIGNDGILKLLSGKGNREAFFQSTIALLVAGDISVFTAKVKGRISREKCDFGWGYDPIFIPDSNPNSTYGEMGEEKQWLSHRYFATMKLIAYLEKSF
jgi:XTP/dITP diphosphohydrolase